MHGRKKSDLPQTEDEKRAIQAKIKNYKKVISAVRLKRASGDLGAEYKALLGKVLRLHPDYYSMWNYRKETVLKELERKGKEDGERREKAFRRIFEEELALSVDCINRSPKSYSAWHHHKWALEKGLEYLGGSSALAKQLSLCGDFLELDGRNFHCWAHRMWLAQQMEFPAEEDFEFTTRKINQNFSNYSAFHYRSKLLPRMITEAGRDRWELLDQELELVHDAMFTEPADQSVWWYHHFLLTWAEEGSVKGDVEHYEEVLRSERDILRELIELEGRCKWAELALLLVTHRLADSFATPRPGEAGGGDSSSEITQLRASASDMASRLRGLDPSHRHFYDVLELGLATRARGPPLEDDKTLSLTRVPVADP